ncbi:uncharacterized protein PADG_12417 [Paracoccidioides brasiliensis Pb18]|uniref:Uncharacterized protein n=1 Tax=Paracoccidioides brasiliensis (strain Pb18) TaxID=502780 RepID=A0A0A0HVM1_PARBD|nr:uncharacterized protein PADG_12417 [Paracoccidioides brasiliensis Pb18]KGM91485.1 hypothetical protein PADG_12417 [Paracoccidioides brasiliensis Pb18]
MDDPHRLGRNPVNGKQRRLLEGHGVGLIGAVKRAELLVLEDGENESIGIVGLAERGLPGCRGYQEPRTKELNRQEEGKQCAKSGHGALEVLRSIAFEAICVYEQYNSSQNEAPHPGHGRAKAIEDGYNVICTLTSQRENSGLHVKYF